MDMTNRAALPEHLRSVKLGAGHHEPCENVMNIMELTAAVAGEPWTSQPDCASPALTGFLNHIVNHIPRKTHEQIAYLAVQLAASNCPECEEQRVEALVLTMLRETLPAMLRPGLSNIRRMAIWGDVDLAVSGVWPEYGNEPRPHQAAISAAAVVLSAMTRQYNETRAETIEAPVLAALAVCPHGEKTAK